MVTIFVPKYPNRRQGYRCGFRKIRPVENITQEKKGPYNRRAGKALTGGAKQGVNQF
jgi:hypothetical protein